MLQAANTDLFNPVVLKARNCECQNLIFLLQNKPLKVNLELNWRIFIFCTLGTNGLTLQGLPSNHREIKNRCWLDNLAHRFTRLTNGPQLGGWISLSHWQQWQWLILSATGNTCSFSKKGRAGYVYQGYSIYICCIAHTHLHTQTQTHSCEGKCACVLLNAISIERKVCR